MDYEDKFIGICCIIGMVLLFVTVALMGDERVQQAQEASHAIREGATPFDAGRYVYQEASELWKARNAE